MQLFEKCLENLQEDSRFSWILFRFDPEEKALDEAVQIVKELGVKIKEIKVFDFPRDFVSFAYFKLDTPEINELVLSLSERGYTPIKGYGKIGYPKKK